MAPVQRGAQRLLARLHRSAASRQEPEPIVQPRHDLLDAEEAHACRRQLDGERKAVEPPAELSDRRRILGCQGERRRHQPGALDEEPDGLGPRQAIRRLLVFVRHAERRHLERALARDVEALAAGRQHREPRTRAEQRLDEFRTRFDHVLAVVEDQERLAAGERGGHEFAGRPGGVLVETHRGRNGLRHEPRVRDRGQLDKPDAARIALPELRTCRQGEPGLADPSGAEERQHSMRAEEAIDIAELLLTADEAGHREGDRHRCPLR